MSSYFFFFLQKKPFYKDLSLIKVLKTILFICDINSFLCECDISGDSTQSLIVTFPKGTHRVYVAKNKSICDKEAET